MLTMRHSSLAVAAMLIILGADALVQIGPFTGASDGITSIILLLHVLASALLGYLAKKTNWKDLLPKRARVVLVLFLAWGGIVLWRGAFEASDYWAWKALLTNHVFIYLIPLAMVVGLRSSFFARYVAGALLLVLPLGVLMIPLSLAMDVEIFQRVIMPLYMLILLLPFLYRRWWLILLPLAAASIWFEPTYRANLLRIVVAIGIVAVYYLRFPLKRQILNGAAAVALLVPILLVSMGISGTYNIFRDEIRLESGPTVLKDGRIGATELTADTRTFLYDEVFASMSRRNSSFVFGQGAGTGYESAFFSESLLGDAGRQGSEVGFLNVLMYSGLVGVALYGAIIFLAATYAFNRSKNDVCKLFGLFLLFKWLLFFVEDIPKMDLNLFVTWVMIGFCLSNRVRQLDNLQIAEMCRFTRIPISINGR